MLNYKLQNLHPAPRTEVVILTPRNEPAQVSLPAITVPVRDRNVADSGKPGAEIVGNTTIALIVIYHLIVLFQVG